MLRISQSDLTVTAKTPQAVKEAADKQAAADKKADEANGSIIESVMGPSKEIPSVDC